MERLQAVDALTEMAEVIGKEQGEPVEALLLLQHVHGQHQTVASNSPAPHRVIIQDVVQIVKNGKELWKQRKRRTRRVTSISLCCTTEQAAFLDLKVAKVVILDLQGAVDLEDVAKNVRKYTDRADPEQYKLLTFIYSSFSMIIKQNGSILPDLDGDAIPPSFL